MTLEKEENPGRRSFELPESAAEDVPASLSRGFPLALILVFLGLSASIIAAGAGFYLRHRAEIQATAQQNLFAIARLKVDQIVEWRKELILAGRSIRSDPWVVGNFLACLRGKADPDLQRQAREWLDRVFPTFGAINGLLLKYDGEVVLSSPPTSPGPGKDLLDRLRALQIEPRLNLSDVHQNAAVPFLHFDLIIPLLSEGSRVEGFFVFRIDPQKYIYPLIQGWPVPSESAENLLVRRDGDQILFLNDLRFRGRSALGFRLGINSETLLSAQALRGAEGIVEGTDYRGVEVIGATRKVPETDWSIISKMDAEEAFRPLRQQVRTVLLSVCLMILAAGAITAIFWRSERKAFDKRQSDALMERELLAKKLELLSRFGSDLVVFADSDGMILDVNDRAPEAYGYSGEELRGMRVRDLCSAGRQAESDQVLETAGYSEGIRFETVHSRKSGEQFAVEVSARPVSIGSRTFLHLVIRDISQRKAAESSIRASEEKFRTWFDQAPIGMVILLQERIQDANPAARALFGLPPDRLLNRPLLQFSPPTQPDGKASDESFHMRLREALAAPQTFEWRFLKGDGKGEFEAETGLFGFEIGATVFFHLTLRDITREKSLRQQFLQAQKMETVGRLAGGVAHDFNNLLTAIIGYGDLLLARLRAENQPIQEVEEILKAGNRASGLTRQLLSFSRKQIFQPKILCLNQVIREMGRLLERLLGENIRLVMVLAPQLPLVKVDPGEMGQVLLNLAVNGREAMAAGGCLTIETQGVDLDEAFCRTHLGMKPGNFVQMSISDTGKGMAPEVIAHIFEPFFTTKTKGTGLGLSTVFGIVKQHGGEILCYSEPDRGTTFKVFLPPTSETGDRQSEQQDGPVVLHGTEAILIVEDDEAVRKMAASTLRRYGYSVVEAPDPETTFNLLPTLKGRIELVICDVVMPGMSGPEMMARILPLLPGVPVLYISGYSENAVIQGGFLSPGVILLSKPFTPETLLRKVRAVIDSGKGTTGTSGNTHGSAPETDGSPPKGKNA